MDLHLAPPYSANKVRSLDLIMPSAAASITGVPDFLKAVMNFCASPTMSPRARGCPRFLEAMLFISAPGDALNCSK